MKHIILIDDQYKSIHGLLSEGFKLVYSKDTPVKLDVVPFEDYFNINDLHSYDAAVEKFVSSIPNCEKDEYCILLDWLFNYNSPDGPQSAWHGKHLFELLKARGFDNILIFSNYTENQEFKEILLQSGLCLGKPSDEIYRLFEDNHEQWNTDGAVLAYFSYLRLLLDSMFFDAELRRYQMIFGSAGEMKEKKELIEKAAASDVNVLILGPTGTGKELTARAIHNLSDRKDKRFLAINCSGIPAELLETELFGYAPGTFTDQLREGKPGLFREADGGTVLLDEIGDMPILMQAKLLRFLQDFKVRPVGGSTEFEVNVRIICSTNRDLTTLMNVYNQSGGKEGFRTDLYWRVKVLELRLPSLEERFRMDDELVYILFFHFLKNAFRKNKIKKIADFTLSENAYKLLTHYSWPGNFREFENVILASSALLSANENVITEELLSKFLTRQKNIDVEREYLYILERGGTIEDIPRKYHKIVLEKFIMRQATLKKTIRTEDLIEIVLGEAKSTEKVELKKQCARVTQYLNRKSITFRKIKKDK